MKIFVIIVGKHPFAEGCINSAATQSVKPYIVAVSDGTYLETVAHVGDRVIYINRCGRQYALKNYYDAITMLGKEGRIEDEDVICMLDGDDKLCGPDSLTWVKKAYENKDIWCTYGSYKIKSGDNAKSFNGEYKPSDSVREVRWKASHLKTFRYGVFRQIPETAFIDRDGRFFKTCSDLAIMFPVIELSGLDRCKHINKFLYEYNDENDQNDHKVRAVEQKETEIYIRSLPKYERLESL